MVGGSVIENALVRLENTGRTVRRLWCVHNGDECAVYADPDEARDVHPGDAIWWQSGKIMWSRDRAFTDRVMRKIGYSFTPPGGATPISAETQA